MRTRATAKIKIESRPEIISTLKIYSKGLQLCVDEAWGRHIKNHVKLQPFVYKHLRSLGLQAQLAIACIKQACGMVKKAKSKPIISRCSMRYNFPRSASFKNNILSLATIKGRIKLPFKVPDCYRQYFDWGKPNESLLRMDKRGRCFFLFTFSKGIDAQSSGSHRVLGIDVGVNKLAVNSDGKFFGKEFKELRRSRDRLVNEIQAKGTRASKRKLKALSGWWRQFIAWENHNISKAIVDSLSSGDTIVMEDLSNIRRTARYNKWVHKWAFRQLQSFVEYKAVRKEIRVVYVNPTYTSKSCNRCHSLNTSRHNGFFECRTCGHSLDADLNGARNIAGLYTRNYLLGSCKPAIDLACDEANATTVSVC